MINESAPSNPPSRTDNQYRSGIRMHSTCPPISSRRIAVRLEGSGIENARFLLKESPAKVRGKRFLSGPALSLQLGSQRYFAIQQLRNRTLSFRFLRSLSETCFITVFNGCTKQ